MIVYTCKNCGWQGDKPAVESDPLGDGQAWNHYVCPKCGRTELLEEDDTKWVRSDF